MSGIGRTRYNAVDRTFYDAIIYQKIRRPESGAREQESPGRLRRNGQDFLKPSVVMWYRRVTTAGCGYTSFYRIVLTPGHRRLSIH